MKKTGSDCCVRESVDEDESTHLAVLIVGIERNRTVEIDIADANLVEFKRTSGDVFEGVDVHLVLRLRQRCTHRTSTDLEQIRATRKHFVVVHPDDVRFELIGHCWRGK